MSSPARPPMKDRLTIVTTTHLLPSAPSTSVIESSVKILRKKLNVDGCRHLVYYDQPADGGVRGQKYLANLEKLGAKFKLELYVRPQSGLKKNLIEGIDAATTPYLMFLEHDWAFLRPVKIEELLDVFDKYDFVNHVRFNMRTNDSYYMWDHMIQPEDRIPELPLTRTSSWSNQAHVARISKWRKDWLPIIGPEPGSRSHGVEEKLYFAYNRDIFNEGFHIAHARWGNYIYGGKTARPFVHHINGSITTASILEYGAKVKRLIQRTAARLRDEP
ncbi:glycosyltransferase [Tundrisphaera lichenicola]|uniref:glycosyltransferase n=1 Tax=Tundrisphaera lichenicola TaxID=2029860 RepID=UPI003EBA8D49